MNNTWKAQINQEMDKLIWKQSDTHAVMQQIKGEKVMKKKLSLSMAMIIVISILLVGVAIAASLGVFGQFAELPYGSGELDKLEENATVYNETQTVQPTLSQMNRDSAQDDYGSVLERQQTRSFQFTLEQGYFDSEKVAISYTFSEADKAEIVFGKGFPTGDIPWDIEAEGKRYTDEMSSTDPAWEQVAAYLDTKEPVYVVWDFASPGDGLYMPDDMYLENASSDQQTDEDGTLVGYNTYRGVPDSYQDADSIDLYCNIIYGSQVIYQDETGYKAAWVFNPNDRGLARVEFMLIRNGSAILKTGEAEFAHYAVKAEAKLTQVGAVCTVSMTCPEDWVNAWTGMGEYDPGVDYVLGYSLYADGVKCAATSSAVKDEDVSHLLWMMEYTLPASYDALSLVPEYLEAGEKPDEAITLQ